MPERVSVPDVDESELFPLNLMPAPDVDVPLIEPVPAPTPSTALVRLMPMPVPAFNAFTVRLPPFVETVALVIDTPPAAAVIVMPPAPVEVTEALTVMLAAALKVRL